MAHVPCATRQSSLRPVSVTGHLYDVGMSNFSSPNTPDDSSRSPQAVGTAQRRALLSELDPALRRLHCATLRATLADGVPVSPSALSVVLSAHDEYGEELLLFTGAHVSELLWFAVAEFCSEYALQVPEGCQEALHAVLAVGHASGALHAQSDELGALFRAFHELAAS